MKKYILLGCLILLTACQNASPTPQTEFTPTIAPPTQPEPATATITFTPAPTLTATPIPLYFTDDFNTGDTSAWTSFQTGGEIPPTLAIENGLLRFDLASPNSWYYAIHSVHEYEDVYVAAKFSGPPTGSTGLICRYSESGWYEFNITSDGTYNVLFGQLLGESVANYLPIASDPSEYLTPGVMDYEIGLLCQQNFLSLFINEKLFRKLDVTRFALTTGKAGVAAASFDEVPAIVTLDWFKVSTPQ
jgi:hypothetical protein